MIIDLLKLEGIPEPGAVFNIGAFIRCIHWCDILHKSGSSLLHLYSCSFCTSLKQVNSLETCPIGKVTQSANRMLFMQTYELRIVQFVRLPASCSCNVKAAGSQGCIMYFWTFEGFWDQSASLWSVMLHQNGHHYSQEKCKISKPNNMDQVITWTWNAQVTRNSEVLPMAWRQWRGEQQRWTPLLEKLAIVSND